MGYERGKRLVISECAVFGYVFGKEGQDGAMKSARFSSKGVVMSVFVPSHYASGK